MLDELLKTISPPTQEERNLLEKQFPTFTLATPEGSVLIICNSRRICTEAYCLTVFDEDLGEVRWMNAATTQTKGVQKCFAEWLAGWREGRGLENEVVAADKSEKLPVQMVPPILEEEVAKVFRGSMKLGRTPYNWRQQEMSYMDYLGAMKRHINKLIDRVHENDVDPDTGGHHLAAIASSCAILLDSHKHNNLKDDRP